MTADERCARCGNPLPGANPDDLDVCVPCATIVSLEVERDELQARLALAEAELAEANRIIAWHHPEPPPNAEAIDLVATLQASVEAARERREAEAGGT